MGTHSGDWTISGYVKGSHTLKAGFNAERFQDNVGNRTEKGAYGDTPNYSFQALQDFLGGLPRTFSGPVIQSPVGLSGRARLFGMYLQDAYRLRPEFYAQSRCALRVRDSIFKQQQPVHHSERPLWNSQDRAERGVLRPDVRRLRGPSRRIGLGCVFQFPDRTEGGLRSLSSQLVHYNGYFQIPRVRREESTYPWITRPFRMRPSPKPGANIIYSPTGTGSGGVSVLPDDRPCSHRNAMEPDHRPAGDQGYHCAGGISG